MRQAEERLSLRLFAELLVVLPQINGALEHLVYMEFYFSADVARLLKLLQIVDGGDALAANG